MLHKKREMGFAIADLSRSFGKPIGIGDLRITMYNLRFKGEAQL
jgi:hypothetical protein